MSHCKDFVDNAMYIYPNFTQTRRPNGEYLVSASFNVSRPSETVTKAIVQLDYCTQHVGKTCEHFQTWRFGRESCSIWQSKNTMWSGFIDAIKPHYSCPFKAGHYVANNGSLDGRMLNLFPFPLEDKEWNATVNVYDDNNNHWLCGYLVVKMQRSRGHT
ncbi:hypothetical protein ONE63_001083 [Megalurothrips usitatus]|uniref:Uncharacterized protein n=1 Tax=Megalurothrips usitatus TaxID=439358 RepID=A0AAV7XD39_9NEOP|nr:hypothetical protein ONE63_001083 [Megalurothrips usitatus]